MIYFFGSTNTTIYAVQTERALSAQETQSIQSLLDGAALVKEGSISGLFEGPRAALETPWSSNAVAIFHDIGIDAVKRVEEFHAINEAERAEVDYMLHEVYTELNEGIFAQNREREEVLHIKNIAEYNAQEGLSMSDEEVEYLEDLAHRLGRKLTDAEVFGFSQVNSEHCRHKIFNGTFVIDGEEKESSLFKLIKKTSHEHPNFLVSAYMDNVAFVKGPQLKQFAPQRADVPSNFELKEFQSVISLKAETHNYPTTVEPFNGAGTGSGGEVRDRMAGGQGSIPLAASAVYMTAYPRLDGGRKWEEAWDARKWLYQSPEEVLTKASQGVADFGNKFGQPLITGSILTFEHQEDNRKLGYDKVIMMAGGVGYGKEEQAMKKNPQKGDKIVIMGGENYRIGMGGAAVSSVDTGVMDKSLDLNAVQRSNPEKQKTVSNAVRALVERDENVITSIHDHGAGGHLNCFSELVENTGGNIDLDKLPLGDPTLSAKEVVGNESQERMGLVISEENLPILQAVAERERADMHVVGDVTDDHRFKIESATTGEKPVDFQLTDLFGSSPKTIMEDKTVERTYEEVDYKEKSIEQLLEQVLQMEAVACKDWLLNKSDRSATGLVAKQPTVGPLQLPLNNCGVMGISFESKEGIATSVGHAPAVALIDETAGSRMAIAESLTNIVWAPLQHGLKGVSLSANWMWPCRDEGEDARLYNAVEACSNFAIDLGINIPTGKDSLSMKQKYEDDEVIAPGTVIISTVAHCADITQVVEPVLQKNNRAIYYINMSGDDYQLGGSSLAQSLNRLGQSAPDVKDVAGFAKAFNAVQKLISAGQIDAGHDISAGGLVTTLLEMCFADNELGAEIDLSDLGEKDFTRLLFAENVGLVFQASEEAAPILEEAGISFHKIGRVNDSGVLSIQNGEEKINLEIPHWRDVWYRTSFLFEQKFISKELAQKRFDNYKKQALNYRFPEGFTGQVEVAQQRPQAAIIREKGSHSERETAYALFLAGFDVRDVHMTDLIAGRETLEDVNMIAFVGGATNSNVLGGAKGWAASFQHHESARVTLEKFYARPDTLSIGIDNGAQLMLELGLLHPTHSEKPQLLSNESQVHESIFSTVRIEENNSVMFSSLAGSVLGTWFSSEQGRLKLPLSADNYSVIGSHAYSEYPAQPFGSDLDAVIISDETGRHVATMAHIERGVLAWQWPHYLKGAQHAVTPWLRAFENARDWLNSK